MINTIFGRDFCIKKRRRRKVNSENTVLKIHLHVTSEDSFLRLMLDIISQWCLLFNNARTRTQTH